MFLLAKTSYQRKEQVCHLMWSCDFMPAILILCILYPFLRDKRSGRLGVHIRCPVVKKSIVLRSFFLVGSCYSHFLHCNYNGVEGKTEGRLAAIFILCSSISSFVCNTCLFQCMFVSFKFRTRFVVLLRHNMYHMLALRAVLSILPEYSVSLRFACR